MRSRISIISVITLAIVLSLSGSFAAHAQSKVPVANSNDTIVLADSLIQDVSFMCDFDEKDQLIIVNSPLEFARIFGDKCALPDVNLKHYTMLYFSTNSSGCYVDYYKTIKIKGDKVFYIVRKVEQGGCMPLRSDRICVAVPKIDASKDIELTVVKSKKR